MCYGALGYISDHGNRWLFIDGGGNHATYYDERALAAERLFTRDKQVWRESDLLKVIVMIIIHVFVAGMSIEEIMGDCGVSSSAICHERCASQNTCMVYTAVKAHLGHE